MHSPTTPASSSVVDSDSPPVLTDDIFTAKATIYERFFTRL
jgi:hypothetical protein